MKDDKVSILMPFKNEESHLSETLSSILQQSHENWELIAVDDHSNDQSAELVGRIRESDPRVRLYKNQGTGILDALLTAQDHISGTFVSRMDADDLMPQHRLTRQVDLLKQIGPDCIVTGKVEYFSDDSLGNGFKKYEKWLNGLCDENRHFEEVYKECVIPSPAWMMYVTDFFAIRGFKGLQYPEDYDFVFRLYKNNFKVASIPQLALLWRDHPKRASRNLPQYAEQTFFPLKWRRFREIDLREDKPLLLLGAGKKGKALAKLIISSDTPFTWVSGNEKKQGKDIYGKIIAPEEQIFQIPECQIIVAVSSPEMLTKIRARMGKFPDVYYFC